MLTLTDLTIRVAGRPLIEASSVFVPEGAKVGVVGRNGTGKSTLFRAITGELSPEAGSVELPKGVRIGGVAQEAPGTDEALIDIVLAADTERAALMAEAETASDAHRIAAIQTRLTDIDAHSAEARAASILAGLGFDDAAQRRPAAEFSGGWRMRVALAAVLFAEPDLLLLDEPTNYLDIEGTMWLESYLARYPRTVLLISHDRDLLDNAVTSILHLENRTLTLTPGNFTRAERLLAEKRQNAERQADKDAAARAHMQAFVDRFRAQANKAKQAQSRLKALERMGAAATFEHEATHGFAFPEPRAQPASPVIAMDGASVGYGEAPVLRRLSLRLDADDRIALLGANGNGKSTFAKLIAGRLDPMAGGLTRAPKLDVAIFAQHQMDDLVPQDTAVDHVRRALPRDAGEAKVRAAVARMGLPTEKMDTPAEALSGGEKARLLMGLATMHGPSLLILDEPTNHLDMDGRAALVDALNAYKGAVIVISHDRHLIEATAERLWLVDDGTVTPYDGDLDDYRALVTGGGKASGKANGRAKAKASGPLDRPKAADLPGRPGQSKQSRRREAAERRERAKPLATAIKAAEREMADMAARLQRIDDALASPGLFERDPARGAELSKERARCEEAKEAAEERWLALSEEYEVATAA